MRTYRTDKVMSKETLNLSIDKNIKQRARRIAKQRGVSISQLFEDAIHYHSALESGCQAIITRNIRDFRDAGLPVLNPEDFLLQFR